MGSRRRQFSHVGKRLEKRHGGGKENRKYEELPEESVKLTY